MDTKSSVYFLPLGDKNTASSRLRVYLIAPFLEAKIGTPEEYGKGDTLVIQKNHNPNELRKAKSQGARVIFDIDDPYLHRNAYLRMVEEADVITVDTEERKKYVERFVNKDIIVIPDALDWDGIRRNEDIRNGIAGWTGYGNNAKFLEGLNISFRLRLITTNDCGNYYPGHFDFVQWSLETVDKEIRGCELMINRLPYDEVTTQKGMHKLLKSWANGVPCYTSRIPDYVKAMEEAGIGEKYLVDNWGSLVNIGFDEKCFEYALKYSAENVANLWRKIL